jgi:NADPH:quinone reductase-like Zn-dependent oxidoreductase
LTAWQALVDTAHVRPGQRVLVHAAAGGVGHLAVQIAKALGAHVTGTARRPKHGLLRALGADDVIDYTETDLTTRRSSRPPNARSGPASPSPNPTTPA